MIQEAKLGGIAIFKRQNKSSVTGTNKELSGCNREILEELRKAYYERGTISAKEYVLKSLKEGTSQKK